MCRVIHGLTLKAIDCLLVLTNSMTFLPLIERELRATSRKSGVYWTRCATAGIAALVCLVGVSAYSQMGVRTGGADTFFIMAGLAISLAGCGFLLTCDVIGRERREGTLGLLMLTRVRGVEIVLAKFLASGLVAMAAVLALVPVIAIPVTEGGVTGNDIIRVALSVVFILLDSLAIGIWVSARDYSPAKAACTAFLIVALLIFVPGTFSSLSSASVISLISPAAFFSVLSLSQIWLCMAYQAVIVSMLLASTARRLRTHGGTSGHRAVEKVRDIEDIPAPPKRPLADGVNPVAWRVGRERSIQNLVWVGIALVWSEPWIDSLLARLVGMTYYIGSMSSMFSPVQMAAPIAVAAINCWVVTRFFLEARQSGALELLQSTPLGPNGVLRGAWAGLSHLFFWPVAAFVAVRCVQAAYVVLWTKSGTAMSSADWLIYFLGRIPFSTPFHYAAYCWAGMWCAYRAKSRAGAIAGTWAWTFFLAYIINNIGSGLAFRFFNIRFYAFPIYLEQICMYTAMIFLFRHRLYKALGADYCPFLPPLRDYWRRFGEKFRNGRFLYTDK